MSKVKDLIGQEFTYLTVIERTENTKDGQAQWLCECKCGVRKIVLGSSLIRGHTKSCGCLKREKASKINSKYNRYEFKDDYVVGYTFRNEPFYFDIEDYDLVKNHCWCINSYGYVVTGVKGTQKQLLMHRLITGVNEEEYDYHNTVDHKGGKSTRNDNRKSNLIICTQQQNMWNKGANKNNKLGVRGVCKHGNKYEVRIQGDYLGTFDTIEEASQTYEEEAKKRYGEFYNDRKEN